MYASICRFAFHAINCSSFGKCTLTRVLIVSLLAIVRVRPLLPGSSSSTSSQYAWNWRVSGTQNFRIWFSPGSVHSTPRRVRYSEHGFGVALASKGVVCWRPAVDSGCFLGGRNFDHPPSFSRHMCIAPWCWQSLKLSQHVQLYKG